MSFTVFADFKRNWGNEMDGGYLIRFEINIPTKELNKARQEVE